MSNFKVKKIQFERLENREMKTGGLFALELAAEVRNAQTPSVESYRPEAGYTAPANYGAPPELQVNYGGFGGSANQLLNPNLGANLLEAIDRYGETIDSPGYVLNLAQEFDDAGLGDDPYITEAYEQANSVAVTEGDNIVNSWDPY